MAADQGEPVRLEEVREGDAAWRRWGPYLAERQWGTVREDYSADGNVWTYFPHDHARSRAYRWGEDGLLGLSDDLGRLAFAFALWNERDPILKERFFGLTGPEGNHGEDVKECYYYVDATPAATYLSALYKYPQAAFPYTRLVEENRRRGRDQPEFELAHTGVFDAGRYFDVQVEYAKRGPEDILIRLTVANRGPDPAPVHVLPTLWFRNAWGWGRQGEGFPAKPSIGLEAGRGTPPALVARHEELGEYRLLADAGPAGERPTPLFTDNETNRERLFGVPNGAAYVKDAFHRRVIEGDEGSVNPEASGTKAAFWYRASVPPGGTVSLRLRLLGGRPPARVFGPAFAGLMASRRAEADRFHAALTPAGATAEEARVLRQARAGLVWSKQFYYYDVPQWLAGDPAQPRPPAGRRSIRNADWTHLNNRDVLSMPDGWEYPWYAAWDLAFHMIPFAQLDPEFAKDQLVLMLREWYMHPNGQIPAYEFALGDVNPPVHAWACWRVYKMTGTRGHRDLLFLARTFQKLLLNFTWWVNRKDLDGNHLFTGGFLGLDNIGVFDRSKPLPTGGHLEQADGTAWMAFYCTTMLSMSLELARHDPAYEDLATKFFEHFVAIADAMNTFGGSGLWDERDGFYYDQLHLGEELVALRVRSLVGLIPLLACELLEEETFRRLPDFRLRHDWFLANRADLGRDIAFSVSADDARHGHRLLAVPSPDRLRRVLRYVLDEREFLSPYGIRSLSRVHRDHPYVFQACGEEHRVEYSPGESPNVFFGGNSNWRGPVWFPINYLLLEAFERYHRFYGDAFVVECPVGSGRMMTLQAVAQELAGRLSRLFLPDARGRRPCHGDDARYAADPAWRDLVLFYEHFDGETGRGLGASHQTGWTALVTRCIEEAVRARRAGGS